MITIMLTQDHWVEVEAVVEVEEEAGEEVKDVVTTMAQGTMELAILAIET